jgi:peroxiredoxin
MMGLVGALAMRGGRAGGPLLVMYHKGVKWQPILLAGLMLWMTACYSGSRPPRIGESAPDFSLQDSTRTVALHDLRGKVVVLNFWATWCPPCVEEMPSLVQMQSALKDKGVTVLAVSLDVDGNAYHRFLRDHNVNLLAVRDPNQKSSTLYGTFKYPETYIIDRQGKVRRKFIGPVDWMQPEIVSYLGRM